MSVFKLADYALDIGTTRVRLFEHGRGVIVDEAVEDLVESVDFPDRGRRIAALAKAAFEKAGVRLGFFSGINAVMIAVPGSSSDMEKRVVEDALLSIGVSRPFPLVGRPRGGVWQIEMPMAAAIGAGEPVSEPQGVTVVDIGASRIQAVVITLAGIVCKRESERSGRDDVGMLSGQIADLVRSAISGCLAKDRCNLVDDIVRRGVVLTGGGAEIPGLVEALHTALGIPVKAASEPRRAIINGAGSVLKELDELVKVTTFGSRLLRGQIIGISAAVLLILLLTSNKWLPWVKEFFSRFN